MDDVDGELKNQDKGRFDLGSRISIVVGLTEDMAQDKILWRDRIKILYHRKLTS